MGHCIFAEGPRPICVHVVERIGERASVAALLTNKDNERHAETTSLSLAM